MGHSAIIQTGRASRRSSRHDLGILGWWDWVLNLAHRKRPVLFQGVRLDEVE